MVNKKLKKIDIVNELRMKYQKLNVIDQRQFKKNLENTRKGLCRRFLNKDSYRELADIPLSNFSVYASLLGIKEVDIASIRIIVKPKAERRRSKIQFVTPNQL